MINKNVSSKSSHSPQRCAMKVSEKHMLQLVETSLTTMDTIDSPNESIFNNQLSSTFSFQTNASSEKLQISTLKNVASQNYSNASFFYQNCPIKQISSQEILNSSKNNKQIPICQEKSTSIHQTLNQSKQQLLSDLGLYKLTQIQQKNQLIAIQDKNDDQEENYDISEDEEEEYSIWNDDQLRSMGIDTDLFIDIRGEELSFYQIYRLRSALYQPSYISRLDTIKEVQIISQHYDQEISINELRTQQIYLDQFYLMQTKEFPRNQIQKNPKHFAFPTKQDEKCFTERIQRVESCYEQKENTASKQQHNLQKVSHKFSFKKINQKELSQKQTNDLQDQESDSVITQKLNEIYNTFSQTQNFPLNQKLRSQRRQKVSIDQEQALKLIQYKKIPIKQIKLYEEDSSQISIISNQSPSSNNQLNQQTEKNSQINQQKPKIAYQNKTNSDEKSFKTLQQAQRQVSIQETALSVLQYLKGIIYNKKNEGQQSIQSERIQNSKQNMVDQSLSSPRIQKIEISQLNSQQTKKQYHQKPSQNNKMQQQICSQLVK
ncbi:hypothetical protein ABPG72_000884 [Tetrahymena utriculariae]